jgi:alkylated DNA repair dioxygenase AlkB
MKSSKKRSAGATNLELFSPLPALPEGLRYEEDFLDAAEEKALVAQLSALPLREARYKEWTAKRRVVSYGGHYDFDRHELLPEQPMPPFLASVRDRAAKWAGIAAALFDHALVAEYRPGTELGWHRDVPEFSVVIGISLAGSARMRLRRYPHVSGTGERALALELAPRSIYSLRGDARWRWQHAISPTKTLRYSLTFRTLRR